MAHKPLPEKLKKLSINLFNMGQGVQFANLIKENDYKYSSFYETSITKFALEVKCPFSKKENTIGEACNDTSFYLYNVNEDIKLKESHLYFYQCQGVMAILGLQELDFIVYNTLKDHHIGKITFQNERWYNNILPELTDFYFDFVKDVIFRV